MPCLAAGPAAAGNPVNLPYVDYGQGKPLVLLAGWPLGLASWGPQLAELPRHLHVITCDRRGFGQSSKLWDGYDYDTLSGDLKALLDGLELKRVTLVGFCMGAGEVVRYFSRHGGARASRVARMSDVTPYLVKTADNPFGQNRAVLVDWTLHWALEGRRRTTTKWARAWSSTDSRADLPALHVPTRFLHGGGDVNTPLSATVERSVPLVPGETTLKVYEGQPHSLNINASARLNADLLVPAGVGLESAPATT